MANELQNTIIGNVTADPEVRFTPSGVQVVKFTVAVTPRYLNTETNVWIDGNTMFMQCTAWRDLSTGIAESVRKGNRVIVTGTLRQNDWTDNDGNKRSRIEMVVTELGLSTRWATVKASKMTREEEPSKAAAKK